MTALAEHLLTRPEMPRPFIVDSSEAIAFHKAMTEWTLEKVRLQREQDLAGFVVSEIDMNAPTVTPRADYIWRDIPKRKSAKKPAWAGATKLYNAQKQAESRAKKVKPEPVCRDCGKPRMPRNQWCEACRAKRATEAYYRARIRGMEYKRKRRKEAA